MLEELRVLAPTSVFGSAFVIFSDEVTIESALLRANRFSGEDWWSLVTETKGPSED